MWGFLVALISGALMSVQGVFNTEVTKQTSLWVSTGWVQLSAFVVCVAAWLFTGRQSIGALWQIENKYTLLGGVIGAFITITVIQSMGALGPAKAAMLIVISQLIVAYVIELFGMFGARELIEDESIRNSEIAFPDLSRYDNLETFQYLGIEADQVYGDLWNKVKSS